MGTYAADLQTLSIGLLVVRVVVGLIMAGHGAQKLFGWFGGYGVRKTVTFGFLGPIGPALMVAVMIVAAITVHWGQGLFAPKGVELPLLYGAAAFALALTGYGQYSLDNALGIAGHLPTSDTWIALALGIVGGFVNLAIRRRPVTPAPVAAKA
jgi:putative oxidoreductase